jgi:hypothetical protein
LTTYYQKHFGHSRAIYKEGGASEAVCKGLKQIILACQARTKKLDKLFQKVIPSDNASRWERYLSAVKTLGKGNTAEKLMKGMLEDVQLLVGEHDIKMATKDQIEQIADAIKEVSAIPLSISDGELQEHNFAANHSGSGTQYNAQGEYIAQGNARQYNSSGAPMHFGKD